MSTGYEFFGGAFVFMPYNRLFDGTILTTSSSDAALGLPPESVTVITTKSARASGDSRP